MGHITLGQAAAWCGGWVDPKYAERSFLGASNDSRSIRPGQLFLALQGVRDGHDFIPMALERGAAAALCSRTEGDYPAIVVEDVRKALGDIARQERQRLGMKVVGVTGSVGKSTTKEMIWQVLARKYRVEKTPVNHNNDIGMPMAVLEMPEGTQVAVLEMGMNHFREIAYLASIARPDLAVITNIGTMHIEHLGSQEGILRAKLEILEGMADDSPLILNGDDPLLWNVRTERAGITYFGAENTCCQVLATDVREEMGGTAFRALYDGGEIPVRLNIEGLHFVDDALAAVTVGLCLGVEPEQIRQALADFQNMAGRQELLQWNGCTIIQDYYNAGPESMAAALAVLGKRQGRRIAVLGDMLELGSSTQAEHYRIGRIAVENADMVLAFGPNSSRVISGAITGGMPQTRAIAFEQADRLAQKLKQVLQPGDTVLVKGSHGMHMEQILELLQKDEQ